MLCEGLADDLTEYIMNNINDERWQSDTHKKKFAGVLNDAVINAVLDMNNDGVFEKYYDCE